MNLRRFLVLLAFAVAMGIGLVFQHSANVRLGYRIARLEEKRGSIAKENARISTEIAHEKNAGRLMRRLKAMGLDLEPAAGRTTYARAPAPELPEER
jgi:hypothetical protein